MRRLGCFTVALTLSVCAIGCGGGGTSSGASSSSTASIAGEPTPEQISSAIDRYTEFAAKGQWDRSWELLLPAQQKAIPKDKFVACHSGQAGAGDVQGVTVTNTSKEQMTPPGMSSPTDGIVVTFDATVNGKRSTSVVRLLVIDGQLRIALEPSTFRRCSTS